MKNYYPDPAFLRQDWIDLSGEWEFAFDDQNQGLKGKWYAKLLPMKIHVPFVFQCEKSGINDKSYHPILWYRKEIELPHFRNKEVLLSFNGVDYKAMVYVNGSMVAVHEGGYTPFHIPVSAYLKRGKNVIALRVEDYHDTAQPRGKQIWTENNHGCWYTASSGIWKDVWLQITGKEYIEACRIIPDLNNRMAHLEIDYPNTFSGKGKLAIELLYNGRHVNTMTLETEAYRQHVHLHVTQPHSVDDIHTWSPEKPNLYDVALSLYDEAGSLCDKVVTYFGMRDVSIRNGQILLNNRPIYQKLILDQGYWDESLLTPPDKEALKKDLGLAKSMGFNGVRKHQKIEDPWFYYYADKLGLMVWAELPSPYCFSTDEIVNVERDMTETVRHLYNHPCIITWVPFNESWGIRDILHDKRQQQFVKGMYHLLKAMDPLRFISANDGWEQPIHEFVAIHDYLIHDQESYDKTWGNLEKLINTTPSHRQVLADCDSYNGAPVLLTEYGGIALQEQVTDKAWGYRGPARDKEEYVKRLTNIMDVIYRDSRLSGFCYTQLTDVQQEVNGLLKPDRTPKCSLDVFYKIFSERA